MYACGNCCYCDPWNGGNVSQRESWVVAEETLRIKQHGANSGFNNHLMCTGIELYGTLNESQ